MKHFLLLGLAMLVLGCSSELEEELPPDTIQIRIKNSSSFRYENIRVDTSSGEQDFGALRSNRFSAYKVFDVAYRYAWIELEIDGEIFTIQPIDYVGETPLDPGKYTYAVSAGSSGERYTRLTLVLEED